MYYRDALGAIIVYDITYKESFDKVNFYEFLKGLIVSLLGKIFIENLYNGIIDILN